MANLKGRNQKQVYFHRIEYLANGFKYVHCCFKNEKKTGHPRKRFAQRLLFNRSEELMASPVMFNFTLCLIKRANALVAIQ